VRVVSIVGGDASNAIPSNSSGQVAVPEGQEAAWLEYVEEFEATIREELQDGDPNVQVDSTRVDVPGKVMEANDQTAILDSLLSVPDGVIKMSDVTPGLVETSNNVGVADIQGGTLSVSYRVRSSVDSEMTDVQNQVEAAFEGCGATTTINATYPSWTPNVNSPILNLMEDTYLNLFGHPAGETQVHAGIEPAAIGGIYPTLDMIAFGPTLQNVHTTQEQVQIVTVGEVYKLLLATLDAIP